MTLGWVAFGLSSDRLMGMDGIDDVFACQRDATTDIVYAQETYNPQSPRGNIVDSVSVTYVRVLRMETSIMTSELYFTPTLRTKLDLN